MISLPYRHPACALTAWAVLSLNVPALDGAAAVEAAAITSTSKPVSQAHRLRPLPMPEVDPFWPAARPARPEPRPRTPVPAVTPPPAAQAAPPPPPVFPYRVFGVMTNPAGARVLYLQLDQRLVAAPVGTRLESGYVVVSTNDRGVVVEHAESGSRLSLAADGAAPAPVPR